MEVKDEREIIRNRWPVEWRDGLECGFLQNYEGERDSAGYPKGFHKWTLEWRNAWYAGFNLGFHERVKAGAE